MEIQSLLCHNNITNAYLWQHCNGYFVHITFLNDKKVRKNKSSSHYHCTFSRYITVIINICNDPMNNA